MNYNVKTTGLLFLGFLIAIHRVVAQTTAQVKNVSLGILTNHFDNSQSDSNNIKKYYALAIQYKDGINETQDYTKAFQYFNKAADLGDAQSIYALGYMHYKGLGCTQDYTMAAFLFSKGAYISKEITVCIFMVYAGGMVHLSFFKFNYMKRYLALLVLMILCFGCNKTPSDKIIDYAKEKYGNNFKTGIVNFPDIFSFPWEKIYMFSPLLYPEDISEAIGFKYNGDIVPDDTYLFLFVNKGSIVKQYTYSDLKIGFSDNPNTGVYVIEHTNSKYKMVSSGNNQYWLYKINQ